MKHSDIRVQTISINQSKSFVQPGGLRRRVDKPLKPRSVARMSGRRIMLSNSLLEAEALSSKSCDGVGVQNKRYPRPAS